MKKFFLLIAMLMVASLVLAACQPAITVPDDLGTEENPITWVMVPSGDTERISAGGELMADLIYDETGLVIETFVATDYTAAVEAICANPPEAWMASLATFAMIAAADRGCVEPALIALRRGTPGYPGQIYVNNDTGITSLEDLKGSGAVVCAGGETSTSGWILPSIMLQAAGIDLDNDIEVNFLADHESVAIAVYQGDCDVGTGYVDTRSRVEEDYPDIYDMTTVIEVSVDIPNDGIQYHVDFPQDLADQINAVLIAAHETDDGFAAINKAHQWEQLVGGDMSVYYDPFRQLLDAAGVSAADRLE
jgi:phosphonate transport system substrate-binding protein